MCDSPARKARSTNFSTSVGASSTVRPMTLISLGTGNAALGVFRKLLCSGPMLNCIHGLAGVVLKIAEHGFELLLHLTDFDLLLLLALRGQARRLFFQFLFTSSQAQALRSGFAQVGVQAIEKAGDVLGLRSDFFASDVDDLGVQAEALSDVDARRRARHSDMQFVGRLQSGLVE